MMAVYVFFGLFFVLTIALPPSFLRSSSVPNSMKLPFFQGNSEGSSSLVRRKKGLTTDLLLTLFSPNIFRIHHITALTEFETFPKSVELYEFKV